jgi:DNA-binding MarR family transcriptional regulator
MSIMTAGEALGDLVVEVFRLNGLLLSEGDRLTADLGMTSARWQVLGAVSLAGSALTVSQIARHMGLARQSVQRLANEMHAAKLISFADNPDHRRAKLVAPTAKGRDAYRRAMQRQTKWAKTLLFSSHTSVRRVQLARAVLRDLSQSLSEANP